MQYQYVETLNAYLYLKKCRENHSLIDFSNGVTALWNFKRNFHNFLTTHSINTLVIDDPLD